MATLNGAKYLTEQLASLQNQTMPPRRLIVSDDGSTDATPQILREFATRASFDVTIVAGPQQGYAENFWSAAKLADTKYLAWSDQDDVWSPQKILRCVQALEATGTSFVSHSASVVDEELQSLGRSLPYYQRTRVLHPLQGDPFHVPSGFASVFRREILSKIDWDNRPFSHQHWRAMGHDHVVGLTAFSFYPRLQLSESLARYRQHASNIQGDPSVTGLNRKISTALSTLADDYARLASRTEGYAHYLSLVSEPDAPAVRYFQEAAERARLRERIRNGKSLPIRLQSLIDSARKRNYGPKDNGGFGFLAFLNDSLALCLSMTASASSPTLRLRDVSLVARSTKCTRGSLLAIDWSARVNSGRLLALSITMTSSSPVIASTEFTALPK
jgi:glycosyltransferase involved in cell wall biosynthesis